MIAAAHGPSSQSAHESRVAATTGSKQDRDPGRSDADEKIAAGAQHRPRFPQMLLDEGLARDHTSPAGSELPVDGRPEPALASSPRRQEVGLEHNRSRQGNLD
jgi:hypothetical protein